MRPATERAQRRARVTDRIILTLIVSKYVYIWLFYIAYIYVSVSGLTAEHSGSCTSLLQACCEGVTSSFGTKATRCLYFSLILVFVKAAGEPSSRRLLLLRNRNQKTISSHRSQRKSWKFTALPLNIKFTSLFSFLLEQGNLSQQDLGLRV